MMRSKIKNIILLVALLFISAACHSREQNLPFETISQGDGFHTGKGYGQEEPNILIIAGSNEVDQPGLDIQFPAEISDQLRRLDYDQTFAILVLQGQKRISGYSITLQRIVYQNDQITVEAEFVEPALGSRIHPAFTSPYHLVAVSKEGKWGQQVKFVLMRDSQPVAETTHFIP
ncbi:MAG: protease complex subunit PrcB family protein [Anaerolineae bacterium]